MTKYTAIKATNGAGWVIKATAADGTVTTICKPGRFDGDSEPFETRGAAREWIAELVKATDKIEAVIETIPAGEPEAEAEAPDLTLDQAVNEAMSAAEEVLVIIPEGPGSQAPAADIAALIASAAEAVKKARPYEPAESGAASAIHPTAARPDRTVTYAAAAREGRLFLKAAAAFQAAGLGDLDGVTWRALESGYKTEASARTAIHRLLNAGLLLRVGAGQRATGYQIPEGFMAVAAEIAARQPV